jgi:predicted ABC-class ATPase
MTKIYTENDLLLYLYKELTNKEVIEIENALQQQPYLREKLSEMSAAVAMIAAIETEPSQTSIDMVLEYALELEKSNEHVS